MNNFINEYFANSSKSDSFYLVFKNNVKNQYTGSIYKNKFSYKYIYEDIIKRNNAGESIYFSLNHFKYIEDEISRKELNLSSIKSLFFDIDKDGEETAKKIISMLGQSSFTIRTSEDKYQLIYQFEEDIRDSSQFEYIYQVSKTLTKFFQIEVFNEDKERIDNTFDGSRVARLPNLINCKNGFKIKYKNNNIKYNLKHFEDFIETHNCEIRTRNDETKKKTKKTTTKTTKTPLKTIKSKKIDNSITLYDFIDYKPYLFAYNMIKKNMFISKKLEIDYSRLDQAFFRRNKKRFNEEYENDIETIKSILA